MVNVAISKLELFVFFEVSFKKLRMLSYQTTLCLALMVSAVLITAERHELMNSSIEDDIATLYWRVRQEQWNDSAPCIMPIVMGHDQGKYANNVKLNFWGGPVE